MTPPSLVSLQIVFKNMFYFYIVSTFVVQDICNCASIECIGFYLDL